MPLPPLTPPLRPSSPPRNFVSTTPTHIPNLVHPSYSSATSIHMNPLAGSRINPTTGLRTFDILEDATAPDTPNPTRNQEIETPVSGQQDAESGLMHGRGKKVEEGRRFYDYPTGSMVAIKSPTFSHGEGERESEGGAAFSEEKEVVIGASSSRGEKGEMVDLNAQGESNVSAIYNDNRAWPGRFEDHEIGNAGTARREGSVSQRRVSAITLDDEPYSYNDKTGNTFFGEGITTSPTTYENGKTDGNNANEPVFIAAARQARLNRPTVVDNRPSRLSAYFADGSRAGSVTAKVGSKLGLGLGGGGGGGRGKTGRQLGEDVEEGNGERKRSIVEIYEDEDAAVARNKDLLATLGVIASTAARVPALPPAPAPLPSALEAEAEDTLPGLSYRENRKMSLMDALRSNPPDSRFVDFPKRAATAPTRRRKTTFVTPEPVDVRPGHLFLRQSVVNTPYPEKYQEGEEEGRRFSFPGEQREENEKARGDVVREKERVMEEAVLTVVLYSHGNPIPKLGKVVLPRSKQRRAISVEFPTTDDLPAGSIDDEYLFTLLRDQYSRLRGFWRHLGSARRLQTISLLSFSHLSQLAARHERPVQLKTFRVVDDIFGEQRMLDLFRAPERGRGQREWVDWVEGLPENSIGSGGGGEGTANGNGNGKTENLALEFGEGWSVGKITGALATVLAASLVAMLLWVFIGVGGEGQKVWGGGYSDLGRERNKEGARRGGGAGDRVETGLVLGVLVLLVGWTVTGAWVLLSWLVM